ncbi:MAG: hypothetical protein U0L12_02490 [Ruminococcus sp.]|nr:hypothetical protein [Ruminococcus sp.]
MKKKIWVVVWLAIVILFVKGIVDLCNEEEYSWTVGRCLVSENGNYLIVYGDDVSNVIVLSNETGKEDAFATWKTGDKISVKINGIMETYPAQAIVLDCKNFGENNVEEIPQDVIDKLTEMGWVFPGVEQKQELIDAFVEYESKITAQESGIPVVYYCPEGQMRIRLPEDWEYMKTEYSSESYHFGISFWPKGEKEGKLSLYCYTSGFGVCGTGLEEKEITVAGMNAVQGTYDNHKVWDFISFRDSYENYAILNDGADAWWDSYRDEAMEILETIEFGY